MNYSRVVVIKHGSIGDFVMAFRAMRSIREHFSSSHITLVTTNLINKLFSQIPFFDKITFDDKEFCFINLSSSISYLLEWFDINFNVI